VSSTLDEGRDPPELASLLRRYAAEVCRWNRSINLVSRVDTGPRVDALLREAEISWRALVGAWHGILRSRGGLVRQGHCVYLDLGSGAGFPGFPWAVLFEELSVPGLDPVRLHLVEPREKRSTFLERQIRLAGLHRTRVLRRTWGSRMLPTGQEASLEEGVLTALISVKALAIPDREILEGWRRHRHPLPIDHDRIVVLRFGMVPASSPHRVADIPLPGLGTRLSVSVLDSGLC